MRIVINTAHQRFGGATQVAISFIHECRKYHQNEYFVWVGPGIGNSIKEEAFPDNFHFYYFDFGKINFLKSFAVNFTLRNQEKKIKPDCIISTSGPTYFHSSSPQIIGYNLGLYIYTDSPYFKTISLYHRLRYILKKYLHHIYFKRDANAYVVQTDDVNIRVQKALSIYKVYTVTNTYNGLYNNWQKYPYKLPAKENGAIRLLTISAYYPHKNLEIIPQVVKELSKRGVTNIEFILTVSQDDFEKKISSKESIINIGPVQPEECPSLYNECDIMFLPTLAECFSASYPEAMKMEKPIITTDLGFAHSICGDAALYFEPMNPVAAADKIVMLLKDKKLWEALIKKGKQQLRQFDSAESRAQKYLDLCQQLSNS
jgi:glycosyltransferase involved in cell wall biosynthesis